MRILHIVWSFKFGGIETMLVNIANMQVALGNEIGLLIIDKDKADPRLLHTLDTKINVFYANRKYGAFDLFAYWRMNRMISRYNPDTIHLHSASIYKYLCHSHRRLCNVTLHDICNKANTDHIDKIPQVFAISQSVADDLMNKKGVKSIVNPNGIRPELISDKKKRNVDGLFHIVQVSRLEYKKKGQHILILAAQKLKEKGYNNFVIDFIGDGESRSYLEQLACENGLKTNVRFLGTRNQQYIYDNLCYYDLFVQPSIYEGFGLTVAEAMAARVPVLVSSGQGPEEVIAHGDCGYIFKNGDIDDCAKKIEIFFKGEDDSSIVEKAFDRVLSLYNVKVTVQTYLDGYAVESKR